MLNPEHAYADDDDESGVPYADAIFCDDCGRADCATYRCTNPHCPDGCAVACVCPARLRVDGARKR
jgi:hypothetical protein